MGFGRKKTFVLIQLLILYIYFFLIPGQVYYLTKPKHELGKFQIMNPPGQFFSRSLLLFDNMILHHLQPYYEEAFANVDLKDFK